LATDVTLNTEHPRREQREREREREDGESGRDGAGK